MKRILLCTLLALGIMACTHDFIEPQTPEEAAKLATRTQGDAGSEESNNDGEIVLGQKLNNPYSVENMNYTVQGLYGPEDFFDPTHYYVRFLPQDSLDYGILLSDTTLTLFEYPLDYEISQYGDYYHDPSIPEDEITWQYTVVPVDYQFPQIQYEILEECFIPYDDFEPSDYGAGMNSSSSNVSINGVSGTNSTNGNTPINIDFAELERQAFINSGNANLLNPEGKTRGLFDKSVTDGWLYVYDTHAYCEDENNPGNYTPDYIPLVGATVVAQIFVKIAEGVTNSNGYVRLNRAVSSSLRPHHLIIMSNDDVGIYNGVVKAKVSLGKFSCGDINVCLFRDENQINEMPYNFSGTTIISPYAWAAATVLNASSEYYNYCYEDYVGCTNKHLRILLLENNVDFGGGAPMFSYGSHFASQTYFQAIAIAMLFPFTTPTALMVSMIMPFITTLLPDICINGAKDSSYELRRVTYHELAHASHYCVVGNSFWGCYIDEIVNNWLADNKKVYGNKNNSPYCGVGEMWARYYEQTLLKHHYNQTFDMLYASCMDSSKYKVGDWIRAESLLNVDKRFNLSPLDIFISLHPGIDTINTVEKVRDNLIDWHTNGPNTHEGKVLRFLFDSYYDGIDFVYKFRNTSPMARYLKYKYVFEDETTINMTKFVDCFSDVVIHEDIPKKLLSPNDNVDSVNLRKFTSMAIYDTNVMNMSLVAYYPNKPWGSNHFFDKDSWFFTTDTLNLQYAYIYETDY